MEGKEMKDTCIIKHLPPNAYLGISSEGWGWEDTKTGYSGGRYRSLEECKQNARWRGFTPVGDVIECDANGNPI